MKKIFLVSLFFILISCSNSENNPTTNSTISPPSWIQGTWMGTDLNGNISSFGFRFTSDDFLLLNANQDFSFKQSIAQTISTGGNASVIQNISENSYGINCTIISVSYSYSFTRVSSTVIEYNTPTGGTIELFKQ